jgi:small-conductance mechanosensitive channel
VETATAKSVQAEAIAALVRYGLNFALLVIFFLGFYYYLSFVLLAFAETRYFAQLLLTYLTEPVLLIFQGILSYIPNMIMLGLIAWVTMYIIKGMRVFFDEVEAGSFDMGDFEKHWVNPTFNIARVVVILIALVFAVPYIPGSDSAAFQGLTILVGAMLSLGANSVVSNMLAGLFVIYRRSTSIGDRIQIGDHIGDVVQIMTPSYIADPPEPKIPPGEWDGHLAHHDEEPDS